MTDERIERHRHGYPWRKRFPHAERVMLGEGGGVYSAEGEGAWWLITDEGTMADFIESDVDGLIALRRFDDSHSWKQAIVAYRDGRTHLRVEEALREAVPAIASYVAARAADLRLTRINERDHLQPWSFKALKLVMRPSDGPLAVGASLSLDYPRRWPRLGNGDITLTAEGAAPAFLELKCGAKSDALGPCAWDVLKNALTLRMGDASAAYLLAATTKTMWDKPVRGAELFAHGQWTAEQLRADYKDWWCHWEKEGYVPKHPPARGYSDPLASAPFKVGSIDWELRLSSVTVESHDWFDWEPFASAEQQSGL
jgi:hypothetical protein